MTPYVLLRSSANTSSITTQSLSGFLLLPRDLYYEFDNYGNSHNYEVNITIFITDLLLFARGIN